MGLMENALLSAVRYKLSRNLGMDSLITDIPVEGLREYTDIPYTNRAGKQLFMDILEPEVPAGTELPVIINIHGGGLIDGSKQFSLNFCRQLAKRGIWSARWNIV